MKKDDTSKVRYGETIGIIVQVLLVAAVFFTILANVFGISRQNAYADEPRNVAKETNSAGEVVLAGFGAEKLSSEVSGKAAMITKTDKKKDNVKASSDLQAAEGKTIEEIPDEAETETKPEIETETETETETGTETELFEEKNTEEYVLSEEEATEQVLAAEETDNLEDDESLIQEPEETIDDFYWDGPVLNSYVGTVQGPSGKETYYNLPMGGVIDIMRNAGFSEEEYPYWERDDGCKMLGDYIMVAADLSIRPRGSLVDCSLGKAIVCDTGEFIYSNPYQLDIAVTW